MRIGREIADKTNRISIKLKSFDINTLSWNVLGIIPFNVIADCLSSGAFRNVYSATSQNTDFANTS